MTRRSVLFLPVLLLVACTSSHDLGQGPSPMAGGVYREALRPGLHYVFVKSNVAPWTDREAVVRKWRDEADRLCGDAGHEDLRVEDRVEEEMPPMNAIVFRLPYLVSIRKGYALCASAGLSAQEALRIIDAWR